MNPRPNRLPLHISLFVLVSLSVGVGCRSLHPGASPRSEESVPITYETTDQDSIDWHIEASTRAVVAEPTARLTLEWVNREGNLFTPSRYTVRLWAVGEGADRGQAFADSMVDSHYDAPTYRVTRPDNHRSYTRRTIRAGWYVAEYNSSGRFIRFFVPEYSDGLLIYTEQDLQGLLSGYYPNYGKIRFAFGKRTGTGAQALLTLEKQGATQRIWLRAVDGTSRDKSVVWYLPAGDYTADWYKVGVNARKTGPVVITAGRIYPNLNL